MEDDRSGAGENGSPGAARGADPQESAAGETGPPSPEGGGDTIFRRLRELAEYVSYYAQVRSDAARASVRRLLWRCATVFLLLLLTAAVIVCGAIYLAMGLTGGLRALFQDQPWLGDLIGGLALLAAVGLGAWARMAWTKKVSFDNTVRKYEQRKIRQRERFGRTISDQAAAASPKK